MTRYQGLCVGGPDHGVMRAWQSKTIDLRIKLPNDMRHGLDAQNAAMNVVRAQYRWQEFPVGAEQPGCWVYFGPEATM